MTSRFVIIVLIVALATVGGCRDKASVGAAQKAPESLPVASQAAGGRAPTPAALGLAPDGALQLSSEDRCPVCAMIPKKHAKFASAIELVDGRTFYFCGTGCMLRSHLHPEVFLGVTAKELKRAVVRDYFNGAPLDAAEATWIAGSDVVGPMGPAFVPLDNVQNAEVFRERHGGRFTFMLSNLTDEKWTAMTGKSAVKQNRQ